MHLPYDPVIVLVNIYLKGTMTYVHTETCTQIFIAALSVIVKQQEQGKCLSTGEWIKIFGTSQY